LTDQENDMADKEDAQAAEALDVALASLSRIAKAHDTLLKRLLSDCTCGAVKRALDPKGA